MCRTASAATCRADRVPCRLRAGAPTALRRRRAAARATDAGTGTPAPATQRTPRSLLRSPSRVRPPVVSPRRGTLPRPVRKLMLLAVPVVLLAYAALPAGSSPVRGAPKCTLFPADNPWNQRVDQAPLHPNSAAIVRSIGVDDGVHADFGSGRFDGGPIGIPYTTVSKRQKRVRVSFDYADESDKGPYPIPRS